MYLASYIQKAAVISLASYIFYLYLCLVSYIICKCTVEC